PSFQVDFKEDYARMIDTLRMVNPEIKIFIAQLSPIFPGHRRFKSGTREWHQAIQSIIPQIAKANKVEIIDFFTQLHTRPDLVPDQIHPLKEGAEILAQSVYQSITGDFGGLRLSELFQNGAVIQSGDQTTVFGTANASDSVSILFQDKILHTKVSSSGTWLIEFSDLEVGGPFPLVVRQEKNTITVDSIYVGDVWLLMGQSNLEWSVKQEIFDQIDNNIFSLHFKPIVRPGNFQWPDSLLNQTNSLDFFSKKWSSIHSNPEFSSVGYYFGHYLREKIQVPIGLVQIALGGAPIESFISRKDLENDDLLVDIFKDWSQSDFVMKWVRERAIENVGKENRHPFHPSYIYESAIQDFLPYSIKGVLWYQGESNTHNPGLYKKMYRYMVEHFRDYYQREVPFYFVQLPGMDRNEWPYFREMQASLTEEIPQNFMAVALDLGDSLDVHPPDKREISKRLAQLVLHESYGMSQERAYPPKPVRAEYHNNTINIQFSTPGTLISEQSDNLIGFEWVDNRGIRKPAKAHLSENQVLIPLGDSSDIPKEVYFGFSPFSRVSLTDETGLQVAPFRIHISKEK
ncbi:MAG: hypothetical protein RJA52_992, partial [Bacteroidota bacterium]